jgi:hypothetical protein
VGAPPPAQSSLGPTDDGEPPDGDTVYAVSFSDLPIDSWWGISVYNAEGYFEKNDRDVYRSTASTPLPTTMARTRSSSAAAT